MALAQTAARLIAKNGREAQLVRETGTPASAAAPWDADTTASSTTISMVFVGADGAQANPTNVQQGQVTALIAGLDLADVTIGDRVVDGADTWQVVSVERVQPGTTLFLWKLGLAK